jgi:penicillin-binding protein A
MNHFTRELNRLLVGIITAFSIILLAAVYYALIGPYTLLPREDNPRLVEVEQSVMRGSIYDRDGTLLVRTSADASGFAQRETLDLSVASATGYYSFTYGASGAENAYDNILSGRNLPITAAELILNAPRHGSDVRLTLDQEVQRAIVTEMNGRRGAAIVMAVPSGEILGLVSLPTFDPNTLDEDWSTLVENDGEPFFNRALQGRYQPGTLLQLPILVTSLVEGQTLSVKFPSSDFPIRLDDLTLTCLIPPPQSEITLRDAYLYGCPAPFAQISPSLGFHEIQETFDRLQLEASPTIAGFTEPQTQTEPTRLSRTNLQANVLGQGDINVSPMSITRITAAIINDGNAPQPQALQAIRPPDTSDWQLISPNTTTTAYMTAPNARRLSEIMRASDTVNGVDWQAFDAGGQVALAYTGEGAIVWFTGFAILENKQNIVVTVVLEDTTDLEAVAQIAHQAIQAADAAMPVLAP